MTDQPTKNRFNRTHAISMEIRDPDKPDYQDPIKQMLSIGSDHIIVKEQGIYKALTAETIDPKNEHPETRHSYEKLYSMGSRDSVVAYLGVSP